MKQYKFQLYIVVALSVVLIALSTGVIVNQTTLFSLPPVIADTPTSVLKEYVYERYRSARPSLNSGLICETNVGGSSEDYLVDAFGVNGYVYSFINSTSNDYDFENEQGRSALFVFDSSLSIHKIHYLEQDEKLQKVILGEGGFLCVLSRNSELVLRLYSFDGACLTSNNLGRQDNLVFCDIILCSNGYLLIEQSTSALERTKINIRHFSFSLALTYERYISSPYSLSYLNCYQVADNFLVFANASSDLGSHLCAVICSSDFSPTFYHVEKHEDYRSFTVLPYIHGYVAPVLYPDGRSGLMTITQEFVKTALINERVTNANNLSLVYSASLYYFFAFAPTANVTVYDNALANAKTLNYFNTSTSISNTISTNNCCLFLTKGDYLHVTSNENKFSLTLGKDCLASRLVKSGNYYYCIATSPPSNTDSAHSFGGNDVWIAKIDI